jgi:hypothetical protein
MNDKGAIPLKYLVNGDNEFDFETKVFTNFDAANETLALTLALTTENAQGTATTVSDAVSCTEA